jgi:hypothetical protein
MFRSGLSVAYKDCHITLQITTAARMSVPPRICSRLIVSPSTRVARTTLTMGSNVEIVEALLGPMRSRPAKKVTIYH